MSPTPIVLEVLDLGDERFRLRPWRQSDAPALVRAWNDPAIIEGSSPPADTSVEAARRWIEGCDERRRAGVAFDLVIVDPEDRVIGEVGLSRFDSGRRAAMIGWWVDADARGRGAAIAAVSLVTAWALEPSRLRALIAEIGANNVASIAVAERAGYRRMKKPRNPQDSARGTEPRVWYVATSTVK